MPNQVFRKMVTLSTFTKPLSVPGKSAVTRLSDNKRNSAGTRFFMIKLPGLFQQMNVDSVKPARKSQHFR